MYSGDLLYYQSIRSKAIFSILKLQLRHRNIPHVKELFTEFGFALSNYLWLLPGTLCWHSLRPMFKRLVKCRIHVLEIDLLYFKHWQ